MRCPHCAFIETTFNDKHPIESNREYWRMTEIFVYLHGGKDYCDYREFRKQEIKEQKIKEQKEIAQ